MLHRSDLYSRHAVLEQTAVEDDIGSSGDLEAAVRRERGEGQMAVVATSGGEHKERGRERV